MEKSVSNESASRFFASGVLVALRGRGLRGFAKVMRDSTERKRADDERARLLQSEREKSEQLAIAVREAHHRIKNNLQTVSDLLYLQMAEAGREASREAGSFWSMYEALIGSSLAAGSSPTDINVNHAFLTALALRMWA